MRHYKNMGPFKKGNDLIFFKIETIDEYGYTEIFINKIIAKSRCAKECLIEYFSQPETAGMPWEFRKGCMKIFGPYDVTGATHDMGTNVPNLLPIIEALINKNPHIKDKEIREVLKKIKKFKNISHGRTN